MKKITKDYFASLVGDAYDFDYENYSCYPIDIRKARLSLKQKVYDRLCEYFHDDDLLLEEWIHCQHRRVPFIIHEEDDYGDELTFQIRTGEELYDYFVHMKEEAENGIRRFRY